MIKFIEVEIQDMGCDEWDNWSRDHDSSSLIPHIKSSHYGYN